MPTLFLCQLTNNNIKIIMNIPNKYSKGMVGIPVYILKHAADTIWFHLADIINESFIAGVIPDQLESVQHIHIYKKGDIHNVSNYKLDSLLRTLSKVFEKAICIRIMDYINQHNSLSEHQ